MRKFTWRDTQIDGWILVYVFVLLLRICGPRCVDVAAIFYRFTKLAKYKYCIFAHDWPTMSPESHATATELLAPGTDEQ